MKETLKMISMNNKMMNEDSFCDVPKPGGPLITRQPAEYSWMSGNPTPVTEIRQILFYTGSSTQDTKLVPTINNDHTESTCEKNGHLGSCINTHKIHINYIPIVQEFLHYS